MTAITPPKDNPTNMGPSAQLGAPQKPSFARPVSIEKQVVSVWDPEGNEHKVLRQNANDLVRHAKWTMRSPLVKVIEVAKEDAEAVEVKQADPDQGESPEATELDEAMAKLQALRDKAEGLGIKVDSRWGKKRLNEEIEAIEAAN